MKNIKYFIALALTISMVSMSAQEKKIKFNKGTLKICSSKTFQIEGYDGSEIVIKPLHEKKGKSYFVSSYSTNAKGGKVVNGKLNKISKSSSISSTSNTTATTIKSTENGLVLSFNDPERKKGLKRLREKGEKKELGIYFSIQQKNGVLTFKDERQNGLIMVSGEIYSLKVPNSIKIEWLGRDCNSNLRKGNSNIIFLDREPSKIKDFKGELIINSNMKNTELIDVSGPVSLNSLGGNFTIIFDKIKPSELYSVYTNNGFIDITLPTNSSLNLKAIGKSVFSDLDFKLISEKEINDFGHINQEMNLKLNSGEVRMNLNANYGNIYLREKK